MNKLLRSALVALALVGTVSAASAHSYDDNDATGTRAFWNQFTNGR